MPSTLVSLLIELTCYHDDVSCGVEGVVGGRHALAGAIEWKFGDLFPPRRGKSVLPEAGAVGEDLQRYLSRLASGFLAVHRFVESCGSKAA